MKLKIYQVPGLIICVILAGFIFIRHQNPVLIQSSQVSAFPRPLVAKKIVRGLITVQEFTTTKEFINGVSIRFKTFKRKNTNENILLLTDSDLNVLYREKFVSGDVINEKYREFNFRESRRTGKGHRIYLCLFSNDGDTANSVAPLINPACTLGPCYISVLLNDNPVNSIQNKALGYPGGMILKLYESDTAQTGWMMKFFWFFLIILAACFIVFFKKIRSFIIRARIKPEIAYLCLALPFGLCLVFLTPPFQVPDELVHYCRAFEISEFQFRGENKTVPASIFRLESVFSHLKFNPDAKTSYKEIDSLASLKLDPGIKSPSAGPDYIVPYLPQALGVSVGRALDLPPLIILYLGRLFNLLIAVSLIFLAIKKAPFFKWVFFLLALMPKTEFLSASMSYDAVTIGLSFLLISLFLYYAFAAEKIRLKHLGLLLVLSLFLVLCKPPYFLIGLLFLILPVSKIGKWPRYIILAGAIVLPLLYFLFAQQTTSALFRDAGKLASEETVNVTDAPPSAVSPVIDPVSQISYIRHNFTKYAGLVLRTNFIDNRANILMNFTGLLGWLDTFMPEIITVLILLFLFITALVDAGPPYKLGYRNKILMFLIFLAGLLAIETSMYLYTTYVGLNRMFGIQGRYFIPLAPLFFLLFQNRVLKGRLNLLTAGRRNEYQKASDLKKPGIDYDFPDREQLFSTAWACLLVLFSFICLLITLAVVYLRYYVR